MRINEEFNDHSSCGITDIDNLTIKKFECLSNKSTKNMHVGSITTNYSDLWTGLVTTEGIIIKSVRISTTIRPSPFSKQVLATTTKPTPIEEVPIATYTHPRRRTLVELIQRHSSSSKVISFKSVTPQVL